MYPSHRLIRRRASVSLLVSGILAALISLSTAQDELPKPVTVEDFNSLLEAPPFRRYLSLSDALVVTGVAKLPKITVVTVLNRETNETLVISDRPNPQGWELVELRNAENLASVEAKIKSQDQVITCRFDPQRLQPERIRRSRRNQGKPGGILKGTNEQEMMRRLDENLLKAFETLPPGSQETFRKSFREYVGNYPDATENMRSEFAERTLKNIVEDRLLNGAPAPGPPPIDDR